MKAKQNTIVHASLNALQSTGEIQYNILFLKKKNHNAALWFFK